MFYFTFLKTYAISSLFCFCTDILFPNKRAKKESRKEILKSYISMMPIIEMNLILAAPVFNCFEAIMEKEDRNDHFFIYNFVLWLLMTDQFFYWIHRAMHHKKLYYFHAKHHEYNYTYGPGAIYAGPFDFVIANLFPAAMPLYILKTPDYFVNFITVFCTVYTVVISHGGYEFFNRSHLYHHLFRTKNYGLIFSDRIYNTKIET